MCRKLLGWLCPIEACIFFPSQICPRSHKQPRYTYAPRGSRVEQTVRCSCSCRWWPRTLSSSTSTGSSAASGLMTRASSRPQPRRQREGICFEITVWRRLVSSGTLGCGCCDKAVNRTTVIWSRHCRAMLGEENPDTEKARELIKELAAKLYVKLPDVMVCRFRVQQGQRLVCTAVAGTCVYSSGRELCVHSEGYTAYLIYRLCTEIFMYISVEIRVRVVYVSGAQRPRQASVTQHQDIDVYIPPRAEQPAARVPGPRGVAPAHAGPRPGARQDHHRGAFPGPESANRGTRAQVQFARGS